MNDLLTQLPNEPMAQSPSMDVTQAPVPPMATVRDSGRRPRRWPLVTVASVLALLGGIGVGMVITMPQRNDLVDQRDVARVEGAEVADELDATIAALDEVRTNLVSAEDELTARGADLEATQAELVTTLDDLTAMTSDRDTVTENRDECLLAATAGVDLVTQWENFWDDELSWLWSEPGSAAEAEIDLHMQEQGVRMEEQHDALHELMAACNAG
jgi:hypothetical protein